MKAKQIWFHGTDSVAAEAIKKEGLKPNVDPFDINGVIMANPKGWGEKGFVFVTKDRLAAAQFALYRTGYEHASAGEYFTTPVTYFPELRVSGIARPSAKPVILELELPEAIKIEPDPHALKLGAFRVSGPIPAECIRAIKPTSVEEFNKLEQEAGQ